MSAAAKLRALDANATAGPWTVEREWDAYGGPDAGDDHGWVKPHGAYSTHAADNDLIAALRNALPELIAVVEAADEVIEAAEGASPERWALELALDALAAKLGGES